MSDPNQNSFLQLPDAKDKRQGDIQSNWTGPQSGPYSESEPQSTRASSTTGGDQSVAGPSISHFAKSNFDNLDPEQQEFAQTHYGELRPPSSPPVTSIIKNSPHSKTAIGRLTYQLKDLPELFCVEMTTEYQPTRGANIDDWLDLEHKKMRKDAVKEFLSILNLDHIAFDIAINQNVCATADHVIAPLKDNVKTLEEGLGEGFRTTLDHTKKKAKKDSKTDFDHPLSCKIWRRSGSFTEEQKADLYWKSFGSFLRMRTSQAVDSTGQTMHAEIIEDSPALLTQLKKVDPLKDIERKDLSIPREPDTGLSLGLRISPSLNEHARLHLDFDIVPCVTQGRLIDTIFGIFGKTNLLSKIAEHRDALTDVLKDLQVRCTYVPSRNVPGGKPELLKKGDFSSGRRFCIRKVAMPDDVPTFIAPSFTPALQEQFTVTTFFNNNVLPEGQELKYPKLPVVADEKGHWVPLEMLVIQHAQALRNKRFRPQTREAARSVLSSEHKASIVDAGQAFLDRINVRAWKDKTDKLFETAEEVEFVPNIRSTPKPAVTLTRKSLAMTPSKPRVSMGVIEQADSNDASKNLFLKVRAGLETQRKDELSYDLNNEGHARIQTAKDFTDPNSLVHDVVKGVTKADKPEILLGIMEKPDSLTRHLRTHVDRKTDTTLFVGASKHHLLERFETFKNDNTYFPLNLRAKFNFMLGGTNFNTKVLKVTSGRDLSRLMIVGAHIRRPSDWTTYAPAVCAVVASQDSKALQFPGSARIQKTIEKYATRENAEKTIVQSWVDPAIQNLKDMMVERFNAWTDQDAPTTILFCRDSISFDDKAILYEYQHIKDAYQSVYPNTADPQITFVVYNKNAQLTFTSPVPSNNNTTQPEPTMSFTVGSQKNAYYVLNNDSGLTQPELEELTTNLNRSSQLSSQTDQVAKALPLIWASKLSARVHDYYNDRLVEDAKKPRTLSKGTHEKKQNNRVNFVKDTLLGRGGVNPWDEGLEGTMFYL